MITAMINWYDEDAGDIFRVISDVARLGATQVVAVDGAYANFPDGQPRSKAWQRHFFEAECEAQSLGLVAHTPSKVWEGDEVAKRQTMLDLALAVTPADGWLLIYDADYELLSCDVDVAQILAQTEDDALDITFTTSPDVPSGDHWFRMFMRATPGMCMGTNHYTYIYPDGRHSVVMVGGSTIEADWIHSVRVHHRHFLRDEERHARQTAYYEVRDTQKLEQP